MQKKRGKVEVHSTILETELASKKSHVSVMFSQKLCFYMKFPPCIHYKNTSHMYSSLRHLKICKSITVLDLYTYFTNVGQLLSRLTCLY